MIVSGSSHWQGSFRDGTGTISTNTKTLREMPYSFASRFEGSPGAIPEELLAAAHAGCFNHALANIVGMADLKIDSIQTSAQVAMGSDERGPAVLGVHLVVEASAPDVTPDQFRLFADRARQTCAISKALSVEITMDATLVPSA
jgi:osmotically inducible protein OsmC